MSTTISTRYQNGNYIATVAGKDVAKSPVSEHAAATRAAGEPVTETRPHVFKTIEPTQEES